MEQHLPSLITDLALILGAGAIVTLLFRKIKQPLVLGYIIAGFLISPYFPYLPTIVDEKNVKTLAEIGVIFLLFGLGLEFSFKKLVRVGTFSSITAICEIVFIVIAGYIVGKLLGWSSMDCLFLGGMLASSSTTIIIRAFEELGIKTKGFARVVFGVLVVEDIIVILLMVLLSTIAVTQQFQGTELVFTVCKLIFFLILWFVLGIYMIPTFLKRIKGVMDDEGYLVLALGLCLAMVFLAVQVGFSAELGAFIMGSILAETMSAERIERVIKPVKDLFGTIFFVSVGMMIDPSVLGEYGWTVLIITLLIIFGKIISTTIGAIISGQTLKQSIAVGSSMAQIGEFAFIVATLGMSLGVISDFLFPVAVGASAITTFTTPYFIKYSDKIYTITEKILPNKWIEAINKYAASTQSIGGENEWKKYFKSCIMIVLNNSIILLAIILMGIHFLFGFISGFFPNPIIAKSITTVGILVVASPFIWANMFKNPNNVNILELWKNSSYKNGPLLILGIVRLLLTFGLILYLITSIYTTVYAVFIYTPIIILGLYLASKHMQRLYNKFEKAFMGNYLSRENAEAKKIAQSNNVIKKAFLTQAKTSAWDINLTDMETSQDAEYVGKSIAELGWRAKYGINIVYIKRGERLIYAPERTEKILPFDHLGIIATDEQIEHFLPVFNKKHDSSTDTNVQDIKIQRLVIDEHSSLAGKMIKESGIKEKTSGLVVGIVSTDKEFLNPKSTTVINAGDVLLIVGKQKDLKKLFEL